MTPLREGFINLPKPTWCQFVILFLYFLFSSTQICIYKYIYIYFTTLRLPFFKISRASPQNFNVPPGNCISTRWGTHTPGWKSLCYPCATGLCVQQVINENSFPGVTGFIRGSVPRGGWDKTRISYRSHTSRSNEPWVWHTGLRIERFAGLQILQTAEHSTAN